jgi:outer membrane protein OmpA-like peptidoglycan-associated protein
MVLGASALRGAIARGGDRVEIGRRWKAIVVVALVGAAVAVRPSAASGPEVGANAGVAVPLGDYADTADIGGTVGFHGGYRFSLAEGVSLGLLLQPQFTLLPTKGSLRDQFSDLASMVIVTAGPELVIHHDKWTFTGGGQGGYYRDLSGPLSENAGGWNISGGVGYEVATNATLGLYARYDQANMLPALGASDTATRRLFLGGLSFDYVFAAPPPPPPAPAPPPPPPAQAKRKIVLRGVNFDFDKSNIRPDAKPILNEAVTVLKGEPQIRLTVDGYTDGIGTEAYNLRLSDRRAGSVARYLEAGGIAANRLKPVGHGEADPVATNDTADGRAQNRRVELNVGGGN